MTLSEMITHSIQKCWFFVPAILGDHFLKQSGRFVLVSPVIRNNDLKTFKMTSTTTVSMNSKTPINNYKKV